MKLVRVNHKPKNVILNTMDYCKHIEQDNFFKKLKSYLSQIHLTFNIYKWNTSLFPYITKLATATKSTKHPVLLEHVYCSSTVHCYFVHLLLCFKVKTFTAIVCSYNERIQM